MSSLWSRNDMFHKSWSYSLESILQFLPNDSNYVNISNVNVDIVVNVGHVIKVALTFTFVRNLH